MLVYFPAEREMELIVEMCFLNYTIEMTSLFSRLYGENPINTSMENFCH